MCHYTSSVVRRIFFFKFLTPSSAPLGGFGQNLVEMKYSWFCISVVLRPVLLRDGPKLGDTGSRRVFFLCIERKTKYNQGCGKRCWCFKLT